MTRRLNTALAALLLIIGIPFYWYLLDAGPGDARPKPVTMTQLRALARSIDGPLPSELRVETIARQDVSRNLLVAASGLRAVPIRLRAYQLLADGERITIDAGTSGPAAQSENFDYYDPAAQHRVDVAVAQAQVVLALGNTPLRNGGRPVGRSAPRTIEVLPGHGPRAVAAGIVVVPLAGLDPGAALIYARLASGREILFTGAVARTEASWRDTTLPARVATMGEPRGYRSELAAWLTTINALHQQAPQMVIVPDYDPEIIPLSAGTFSE